MTAAMGGLLMLAALALGFGTGSLAGADRAVFKLLALTRAHASDATIGVARFVTRTGDPDVRSGFVIAALFMLVARRCWRSATVFLVTVAFSISSYSAMKEGFARARPTLVPWLDDAGTYAYPSGHAAGAMTVLVLGALLIGHRGLVAAAVLVAVAIGLSRIALGVHWPSDVVGGWMWGGGAALIGYAVATRIEVPRRAVGVR